MCPGGTVVAATSEPGRVVTNGMSQYSRDERNANAGIVVGIAPEDYARRPMHAMAGACIRSTASRSSATGKRAPSSSAAATTTRPAQLVGDFLKGRSSIARSATCCRRTARRAFDRSGAARPRQPARATRIAAIREAMPAFDRQIAGFAMADAVFTGIETRTSSPLRITRDRRHAEPQRARSVPGGRRRGLCRRHHVRGVDGIEVAEAVARVLLERADAAAVDTDRLTHATPVRR